MNENDCKETPDRMTKDSLCEKGQYFLKYEL